MHFATELSRNTIHNSRTSNTFNDLLRFQGFLMAFYFKTKFKHLPRIVQGPWHQEWNWVYKKLTEQSLLRT